jgi:hypothetical protein
MTEKEMMNQMISLVESNDFKIQSNDYDYLQEYYIEGMCDPNQFSILLFSDGFAEALLYVFPELFEDMSNASIYGLAP